MKSGLVSLLTGETSINSFVGSRVYIGNAPQKTTFPYIVLTQMNSEDFKALDAVTSNLRAVEFDFDCKAKTASSVTSLADAVRVFLKDYSGAAGSDTIKAILLNDESDGIEMATDGSDSQVYVITLNFTVMFNP